MAAMRVGDDANAVCFFNAVGLKIQQKFKQMRTRRTPVRTFFVVIHARAPEFHFVRRKLNA